MHNIHCESSRVAQCASKRKWAPRTTRDTPKRVHKPSIKETGLISKLFCFFRIDTNEKHTLMFMLVVTEERLRSLPIYLANMDVSEKKLLTFL